MRYVRNQYFLFLRIPYHDIVSLSCTMLVGHGDKNYCSDNVRVIRIGIRNMFRFSGG